MGILDAVFAGSLGLSTMLHKSLGGTATVMIAIDRRDEETMTIARAYQSYEVPFIPTSAARGATSATSSGTTRSDVREPTDALSGSIPCSELAAAPRPQIDRVVFLGVEYLIETVDVLRVGNADVQYSITASRV